jgi:hypothetical protein
MNDRAAVNRIYSDYRYEVPDPYGFAVTYAYLVDDKPSLDRLARNWKIRNLKEKRQELAAKIAELEEEIDSVDNKLNDLMQGED